MSFQEQLVSNMFDPTNRLVTNMVAQEGKNIRNAGQQSLAQGTVAQQALWTYDAQGNLVMRDIDEALAIAKGIHAMNSVQQPQGSSAVSNDDLAKAVLALAAKIDAWTTIQA